jgi:hypothetical protein
MTDDARIADALTHVRQAGACLDVAIAATGRAIAALEGPVEDGFKGAVNASFGPATEHRRQHRMGIPSKITSDAEVEAFVRARIAAMTFAQVVTAVAEAFPPERHISQSSLHRWWHRHGKRQEVGRSSP